jgi:hypothetical protein
MRLALVFALGCSYGLFGLLVIPAGLFNTGILLQIWTEAPGDWGAGLLAVAFLAGGELLAATICLLISDGLFAQKRWATYLAAGYNLTILSLWLITLGLTAREHGVEVFGLRGLVMIVLFTAFMVGATLLVLAKPVRRRIVS